MSEVIAGEAASSPLDGLPLLEDLPAVTGRKVLVRVDFNVPLVEDTPGGAPRVEDDLRIRAALPTLDWLMEKGAQVTACTHLGRPKGRPDPRFDVAPVRRRLAELAPGVELLQNLRFDPGEESNDEAFVRRLVDGYDAYVNDAFGSSHRAHASVVGPPPMLPSAAGRLLAHEVEMLGVLRHEAPRPFVAVIGGAKVADKLGLLGALLEMADRLIVGGGMAYTFLSAQGHSVGRSMVDPASVEMCRKLIAGAGDRLLLPTDLVVLAPDGTVVPGGSGSGESAVVGTDVPEGWEGVDIGPETRSAFAATIERARSVFWNGPVGAFEDQRFAAGTRAIAEAIASDPAYTVVGGGDTGAALDRFGLAGQVTFVSTGGGASLAFLEHGDLPGLRALRRAPNAPRAGRRGS